MKVKIVKKLETAIIKVKDELLYIAILAEGWKDKKTVTFKFDKRDSKLHFFAFILGNTGRLFNPVTAILRFGIDNGPDPALLDNRVGLASYPGIHK